MKDNPRRKTLRLKGYDYSQNGMYFVTVSINKKQELLGQINNGTFLASEAGRMVEAYIHKIETKYSDVSIDYYSIMPNHIHVIILKNSPVGHSDPTLQQILYWYKSITTHEYSKGVKDGIYKPYDTRFWQRSYYEHIIRSEEELKKIREYIQNNVIAECIKDL